MQATRLLTSLTALAFLAAAGAQDQAASKKLDAARYDHFGDGVTVGAEPMTLQAALSNAEALEGKTVRCEHVFPHCHTLYHDSLFPTDARHDKLILHVLQKPFDVKSSNKRKQPLHTSSSEVCDVADNALSAHSIRSDCIHNFIRILIPHLLLNLLFIWHLNITKGIRTYWIRRTCIKKQHTGNYF